MFDGNQWKYAGSTSEQKHKMVCAGFGKSEVIMKRFLHLAGVNSLTSMSLLLLSLYLAGDLAKGLLFLLKTITIETIEKTETIETTDTQTIKRQKEDNIDYI